MSSREGAVALWFCALTVEGDAKNLVSDKNLVIGPPLAPQQMPLLSHDCTVALGCSGHRAWGVYLDLRIWGLL